MKRAVLSTRGLISAASRATCSREAAREWRAGAHKTMTTQLPRRQYHDAAKQEKSGTSLSGFLGNNLGKIALGGVAWLVAYLYRSSENKDRAKALKRVIEDRMGIEPWEIDELRVSNDHLMDQASFRELAEAIVLAFPNSMATYAEFVRVVSEQLRKPQLGHYIDRVILFMEPKEETPIDMMKLMAAMSLALELEPRQRIAALHDLIALIKGEVSTTGIEMLLCSLMSTSQLPAETMVIPQEGREYPFQEYKVATAKELLDRASAELKARSKDKKEPWALQEQAVSVAELTDLLTTNAICVWGECYASKAKVKA